MAIKKGDFVEVEFSGIVAENNEVFDTSDEAIAKKNEIYNQQNRYGSVIICVGEGVMLAGLEARMAGLECGKHKISLKPQEAFGNKDAKFIQMIPASKFKEQKIQPFPGLQLNIDGAIGTIKTAGGGRVLVDFNHPLAGKEIIYELNIKRIVTDKAEQIGALLEIGIGLKPNKVEVKGDIASITLAKSMPAEVAEAVNKKIIALCGVKNVEWKAESAAKPADAAKSAESAKPAKEAKPAAPKSTK